MIRVTVWYEYGQEAGYFPEEFAPKEDDPEKLKDVQEWLKKGAEKIKEVYPEGLMKTLIKGLEKNKDFQITYKTLYDEEYGLSDEVLDNTDVLVWWAHVMHDRLPDQVADKVVARIQRGMGFIPLHSAHKSKPFMKILGTSGCLQWREGDRSRVWTVTPTHPIAAGIPERIELSEEEMYGEPFDIPKPDDVVFISWYAGGEVFRSGCTWTRGYGKIFYFQPGHETSPSYHNPDVQQVIANAIRWAAPTMWRKDFECPNSLDYPEKVVDK